MKFRFGINKSELGDLLLAVEERGYVGIVRETRYDEGIGMRVETDTGNTYTVEVEGNSDEIRRVIEEIDPNRGAARPPRWFK
ncbi:hypothetical protein HY030_04305 [Candidatus Gottesmanbacteria bacterium]|nr:hypothetical protein [Candidatus Gottesmanbacteria bacterium]